MGDVAILPAVRVERGVATVTVEDIFKAAQAFQEAEQSNDLVLFLPTDHPWRRMYSEQEILRATGASRLLEPKKIPQG